MKGTTSFFLSLSFAISQLCMADVNPVGDNKLSVERYSTIRITPSSGQRDLLSVVVDVEFPRDIRYVGEAIQFVLNGSGYRLAVNDEPSAREQFYLFMLPLPDAHRQLGPMTLLTALVILGGESFELEVDSVKRALHYRLSEMEQKSLMPENIFKAKQQWQTLQQGKKVQIPATSASVKFENKESVLGPSNYGPVKPGETLLAIALKVKPLGVSREQAMVAIFNHNTEAFALGNMNLVFSGVHLAIPDPKAMAAISQGEASALVHEHHVRWQQLKAKR
jgi:type IV pili sensor histidine kinase/response regulator